MRLEQGITDFELFDYDRTMKTQTFVLICDLKDDQELGNYFDAIGAIIVNHGGHRGYRRGH
ncbi:hypothetical protein J2X69_002837 [Algoriphagus sp. 4150]|uniref:hypothetical protein n=1 Tax=Algoriphagus sp. 4150 TaxID=2817756 RepID=UPI0028570126|nr:hypothetical protein [Algoriphagus sp. 4150]MDR7130481.1 hypothetical protein [Algoriphagus sp. 4150]